MRSATGRRVGVSRVYSLNPVDLPTDHLPTRLFARLRDKHPRRNTRDAEHPFVFVRENLDELRQSRLPIFQDPFGLGTASVSAVASDQLIEQVAIVLIGNGLK